MPNPSKPTCNFSARIDAELAQKLRPTMQTPTTSRAPGTCTSNREWIEAMGRYWLSLSDAERAALLEARDER